MRVMTVSLSHCHSQRVTVNSGDADDVDQGVMFTGPAVPVDDFNASESDKGDANEGSGK